MSSTVSDPCLAGWCTSVVTRQPGDPATYAVGLRRTEVDAACAEVGDFLARYCGSLEDVLLPGDLEVLETGGHDRGLERCIQQRARYSVGPQIDIVLGPLWDLFVDRYVCDLDPPAGA